MIDLQRDGSGVILPVQAQPKARKAGVVGLHNGRLKVAVTEPPDKGKANDALVRALAEFLGVRRSQVELLSGATSSLKSFRIEGITPSAMKDRILQEFA